ncbi:Uma2 family endonuclease [Micromonospora sp. NPDC000668]|uniref:Uma2 family endonuclease n=1 Tax=Micromonospora sp. NPDC000668 TaxID=3364219 RepID=UPI0036BD70CC
MDDRPSCQGGPVERRCDGDEPCAAGIPLYWLVEPRKQTLTVLVNGSGGYREQAVLLGEVYRTEQPFPLALPLADIF